MSGLFDEELGGYLKAAEPGRRERAAAWSMAIGLQAVDGLETSQFLADTAKEHIEGRITQNQARRRIHDYYEAEKESGLGETNELKSRYMLVGLTEEDKREIRRLSEKTADGHPQRLSEKAVRKSGKKTKEKAVRKSGKKKTVELLYGLLRARPDLTFAGMTAALGISRSTLQKHIANLKAAGRLRRVGPDKGGRWEVVA